LEENKKGVHVHHCCAIHGCKYGNEDCPVANKELKQIYLCEYCEEDGFSTVGELNDFVALQEQVKEAKANGVETLTISVALLDKVLNR
jgi:hypothetical protein